MISPYAPLCSVLLMQTSGMVGHEGGRGDAGGEDGGCGKIDTLRRWMSVQLPDLYTSVCNRWHVRPRCATATHCSSYRQRAKQACSETAPTCRTTPLSSVLLTHTSGMRGGSTGGGGEGGNTDTFKMWMSVQFPESYASVCSKSHVSELCATATHWASCRQWVRQDGSEMSAIVARALLLWTQTSGMRGHGDRDWDRGCGSIGSHPHGTSYTNRHAVAGPLGGAQREGTGGSSSPRSRRICLSWRYTATVALPSLHAHRRAYMNPGATSSVLRQQSLQVASAGSAPAGSPPG